MITRTQETTWNTGVLFTGMLIYTLLASQLMFCLCNIGVAKVSALFITFILFSLRLLIAIKNKERSKDWRIYLSIMLLSPVFIEAFYGF